MFKLAGTEPQDEDINESNLRINYGPYEAHGVIAHRIQRLYGLIRHLTTLGFDLEIRQVPLLNRLEILMYGRKIFQCDITNLKFNMISEYDPVCLRAVATVEEAANRMRPNAAIARLALSDVEFNKESNKLKNNRTEEKQIIKEEENGFKVKKEEERESNETAKEDEEVEETIEVEETAHKRKEEEVEETDSLDSKKEAVE